MAVQICVKKDFGGFMLDVDIRSDSKRIGILGASGCGKSMTLRCISGIVKPDSGIVKVEQNVYFDAKAKINLKPRARSIGYLFQNYALFPTMSVEKNIGIGIRGTKAERKEKVEQMMERFQIENLRNRLPRQLSGGQQQRAALARILVCNPRILLLDEPFSALDVHLRDKMQQELLELLEDYGGTVIMVSHNRDEMYRFSEELFILDEGAVKGKGDTKQVFKNPGSFAAAKLTGCKNIALARREGDQTADVKAWDMKFQMRQILPDNLSGVAIRAHEFQIEKPQEEPYLVFPICRPRVTEDLFEYNIAFYTSESAKETIQWKIGKDRFEAERQNIPDEVYLKEGKLLLLEGERPD